MYCSFNAASASSFTPFGMFFTLIPTESSRVTILRAAAIAFLAISGSLVVVAMLSNELMASPHNPILFPSAAAAKAICSKTSITASSPS
jgi:hypothetical protein